MSGKAVRGLGKRWVGKGPFSSQSSDVLVQDTKREPTHRLKGEEPSLHNRCLSVGSE